MARRVGSHRGVQLQLPARTRKIRTNQKTVSHFELCECSWALGEEVSGVGMGEGMSIIIVTVSCAEEEEGDLVSGWGDVEGMREDLLKDWGDILERWDGKDRNRPSRVVKLCRKVYTFPCATLPSHQGQLGMFCFNVVIVFY